MHQDIGASPGLRIELVGCKYLSILVKGMQQIARGQIRLKPYPASPPKWRGLPEKMRL